MELESAFRTPATDSNNQRMLKTIKAVGFETQSDGSFLPADRHYLARALQALRDFEVPLAKAPDIDVVNINHGRDFYTETTPADLVILAHLPSPNGYVTQRANGNNKGVGQVSPLHRTPGIAAASAARCGAKVIAVFARNHDLDLLPHHVERYPYFNLVSLDDAHNRRPGEDPAASLLFHHVYLVQMMKASQLHPHLSALATLRLTRPQAARGQYVHHTAYVP